MNDYALVSIIVISILLSFVLFGGDPDLMDAIIFNLKN